MMQAFDFLVVGGILGTFYAYHAAKMGQTVLLVERYAAPQRVKIRNSEQVVPSARPNQTPTSPQRKQS